MGNFPLLPINTEEEFNNLNSEFNWIEECNILPKNSRISRDYKVITHEKKNCEIYRFFNGLNKYNTQKQEFKHRNGSTDRIESINFNIDQAHIKFDDIIIKSELKYFPSFNGIVLTELKSQLESNEDIIKYIIAVIKNQSNLNKSNYCPNILFYNSINNSENFLYIKRAMWESTIRDKFNELNTEIDSLNIIIKKWLEFQCIISVVQLHNLKIFHGDIKTENMLLNHLLIVKLTDLSPWKPIFIDGTDLRYWTIFFEKEEIGNNDILRCNISPERFLNKRKVQEENLRIYENKQDLKFWNKLQNMDIFSLGCILNEIEKNGATTFTINDILKMQTNYEQIINNKDIRKEWIKNLIDLNQLNRSTAIETLLSLLRMKREIDKTTGIKFYSFENISKQNQENELNRSFPLFFYPLSILLQNDFYCDLNVQLIILNLVLPSFLELFIIKEIKYNFKKEDSDNKKQNLNKFKNKQLDLYIEIFSSIEIKYIDDWNDIKIRETFGNIFDYDLMKDMIFYIIFLNFDEFNIEKNISFESISMYFDYLRNDKVNKYLNLKGFFSLFQFLIFHWDNNYNFDDFNHELYLDLNNIANKIIIHDLSNYDFFDKEKNIDILNQRKIFLNLIKNQIPFIHEMDQSTILYIEMILNCLNILEQKNNYTQNQHFNIEPEIYASIYLTTLNTLDILIETLLEENKKNIVFKKILPILINYLKNDNFEFQNQTFESEETENKRMKYLLNFEKENINDLNKFKLYKKNNIVVFEILNFINKHILKYVENYNFQNLNNEINLIFNFFIVENIEKWLYKNIILKDSKIVNLLLQMIRKILNLIMKNNENEGSLKKWIIEILTSKNSTLKLSLLNNMGYKQSLLFEILNFHITTQKHDKFISEILPYLLDQLNDKDHLVRSGYCELIIFLLKKMNIILILPYGQFCIEKCLNDKDFKVKSIALKCINEIIEDILLRIKIQINKNLINFEKIVNELIESLINNVKNISFLQKYYSLYCEFNRLICNLIKISNLLNNWTIIYILLDNYFDIKNLSINDLLKLLEINNLKSCRDFNYFVNFFKNKFDDNDNSYKNVDTISIKNKLQSENFNKYELESCKASINLTILPFIINKMNINKHFNYIIYHTSLIQIESKYKLRKQVMNRKISNSIFNEGIISTKNDQKNQLNLKKTKYTPFLEGKYLGSIYSHQKLLDINKNETSIGNGYIIYQKISYHYQNIYSWSINNSINSGVYLHKLPTESCEKNHYWNPIINNTENNYIFQFNNNCYITNMISLSDELSIITGDNKGLLTKINLNIENNGLINIEEYFYNDERNVFRKGGNISFRNPFVILLGKLRICSKEMIMSAYSNGDIYIFDHNYGSIDISFTIPPYLGKVIDYCTEDNDNNTTWVCLITNMNIIIIINLLYSKTPKIWKLDSKDKLKITNVNNIYMNEENQSTCVMLTFNEIGIFALFNWKEGRIKFENERFSLKINEINGYKLLYIHYPHLYSSKTWHSDGKNIGHSCNCTYCQIEKIRIFGNCLNHYFYCEKNSFNEKLNEELFTQNTIGPITCLYESYDKHYCDNLRSFYIFNDNSGNVYQKNYKPAYSDEDFNSSLPIRIIESYNEDSICNNVDNEIHPGHRDVITSLNIYYYNDYNNIGLITSSRDGIISYWS